MLKVFQGLTLSIRSNQDRSLTGKVMFQIMEMKGAQFKASDFLDVTSKLPASDMDTTKFEIGYHKVCPMRRFSLGCAHAAIRPYLFGTSRALKGYDFRICVSYMTAWDPKYALIAALLRL